MAVRTSTVPRGKTSQSDFDALLRSEIARTMGRGGEKDTSAIRDQLARRLNAQEGRSTASAAYRPRANQAASARGAGGRGGGGKSSRAPTPSSRPGGSALPQQTSAIPTPNPMGSPDGGSSEMSMRQLIIPILLAAGLGGGAYALNRGRAAPTPMGEPPVGPTGPEPTPVATTRVTPPADVGPLPIANTPATTVEGYVPGTSSPQFSSVDENMNRFLSNSDIMNMAWRSNPYRKIMGMNTSLNTDVPSRVTLPSPVLPEGRVRPIVRYK